MKIEKVCYHRNGISGEGFHVVAFTEKHKGEALARSMLAIVFPTPPGHNCHVAVFDRLLLADGIIEFGQNSWRGDHYAYELQEAISQAEEKGKA